MRLPTKLLNSPLVEVVVEVRLASDFPTPFSLTAPNILFGSDLINKVKTTRLPANDLPKKARDSQEVLKYTPLYRFEEDNFIYFVSDYSFAVSCKNKDYDWDNLSKKVQDIIGSLKKFNYSNKIKSVSLRYLNLLKIQVEKNLHGVLNGELVLGSTDLLQDNASVSFRTKDQNQSTIVNLIYPAKITSEKFSSTGCVIEINSFMTLLPNSDLINWVATLDHLHIRNKETFFSLLQPKYITELGAQYE